MIIMRIVIDFGKVGLEMVMNFIDIFERQYVNVVLFAQD